jgi:hypothetical protein
MSGFIQRASGNGHKTTVVPIGASSGSFGDIRANTIGGANELFSHSVLSEIIPFNNDLHIPSASRSAS